MMLLADATACGSSAKSAAPVVTPSSTESSTSSPPITLRPAPSSTTPPSSGAAIVTATEKDKGATIAAHVGDRVNVVLHSTYWTFGPASDASVLKLVGAPAIAPELKGCVPGGGCGTVTASYDAIASGTAVVSASRNSCGEAVGCTAAASSYRVTITVS